MALCRIPPQALVVASALLLLVVAHNMITQPQHMAFAVAEIQTQQKEVPVVRIGAQPLTANAAALHALAPPLAPGAPAAVPADIHYTSHPSTEFVATVGIVGLIGAGLVHLLNRLMWKAVARDELAQLNTGVSSNSTWAMATVGDPQSTSKASADVPLHDAFKRVMSGDMDKTFKSFLSPTLETDFQQVVETFGTEPPASHGVFGLEFRTVPGVYAPVVQSTTVFLLRAIATGGGHWGSVLELGCGTGAVGLTMLHRGICDELTLSDIFPAAVTVAKQNAQQLSPSLQDKVRVLQSDMFEQIPEGGFDAIVFNMPLLHKAAIDPRELAYSDVNGMLARRFFAEAGAYLAPGGEIWFSYSNVSDPAILEEAQRTWNMQLVLAELKASNGMWKFAYRATLK